MANLFVESEETVYIKIVGDPIFDVYDDEGRIRDGDNELCDRMDNRRDELSLQDNCFGLVECSNLKNQTFFWAYTKRSTIEIMFCYLVENKVSSSRFFMIHMVHPHAKVNIDEVFHYYFAREEFYYWKKVERKEKEKFGYHGQSFETEDQG